MFEKFKKLYNWIIGHFSVWYLNVNGLRHTIEEQSCIIHLVITLQSTPQVFYLTTKSLIFYHNIVVKYISSLMLMMKKSGF